MDLNESKLGLKNKAKPPEIKTHDKSNIIHPKMGILTKITHLMGLNFQGIEELTSPDTRQACKDAQVTRETAIGAAMTYLRKNN